MKNFEKTFETSYGNQIAETHYAVEFAGFGTWSLICNLNFEGERELRTLKTHDSEWIDELNYLQGEEKQDAIAERFWALDTKNDVLESVELWISELCETLQEDCDRCEGTGTMHTHEDFVVSGIEYHDDVEEECERCGGSGECSKAKNL
jgi:hypothetical protein